MTLTQEQLEPYLIGSLQFSAITSTTADLDRSLNIFGQVLGNGHYHLPFFIIHDFMMVLLKGIDVKFRIESQLEVDDQQTRLIRRYERECLARLLQSPDVNEAAEITSTSNDPRASSERLLLQLLRLFAEHYPQGYELNPGLLRDYQLSNNFEPSAYATEDFANGLETFLNNINDHINWGQLLYEEDLFELAHLERLNTDHLRIGCRQILEVSRVLRNTHPMTLEFNTHEDGADSAFVDETHYPTGGLSGLTNRGSYENLLTSELVYIDEGIDGVSLFDLRYAESELLFYLRDSGNLRRKRRAIHFILDVSRIFESKLPSYQWQYSVLLQGFCLRLLHDLFEVFEMDALRFHFHYIESDQPSLPEIEFFNGEIGMMETVLTDYVKHGWVTFDTKKTIELENLVDPKRKSYAIILAEPSKIENWKTILEQANSTDLPLFTSLLAVDNQSETDCINIPRSGLSNEQLKLTKQAVLQQLLS